MDVLLTKYAENPAANWRAKDTAIYLVMALATRGATQKLGVTQTSQLVPLPAFCHSKVLTELERPNVNELPVLKADALKFLMTFRSVLGPEITMTSLPLVIKHLQADSVVVHSYAANSLDKVLILRGPDNKSPLVSGAQLTPFSNELFAGLFSAFEKQGSAENEYVMKAIMRSFATLQEASIPFMGHALPKLTEILTHVAKNPSKPHFNHYLFETFSLTIRIICKSEYKAVDAFEEALFPVFQGILQQDILGKRKVFV